MTAQKHNFQIQISERHKLLLLSLVVGIASGLAAVMLSTAIDFVKGLVTRSGNGNYHLLYLVLPGIGMLVSLILLKYLIKDNIGHGVTKVLLSVSRNESRIKAHNTWSSMLTSATTIGLGGSVGAEAPIVYTGAAIGSNLGRVFNLSYRNITILLGCGAAGAIAGIFKAPLAGMLFTMEILLFNVSMSSMLPLLVSTISSTVIAYVFKGQSPEFACKLCEFSMGNLHFYIIMGVLLGFCSLYFTSSTLWMEDKLAKIGNCYLKWVFCSAGLGLLIFLFPQLYGEGYDSLRALLNGNEANLKTGTLLSFVMKNPWGVPVFFLCVFFLKTVAMTLTNSGGGVGGTFGPTLFSGAIMGFAIARSLNLMGAGVPEQNFVLVGMAALMAGVMQSPLTAIFLIAEISGGYGLLIPLILTSTISFGTVRIFTRYSIYTKRLAQSGDLLTHDSDQAVTMLLDTSELIRDKYPRIDEDSPLDEVIRVTTESTAAVFPVLDPEGRFQGLIDMDTFRKYLINPRKYRDLRAHNVMEQPLDFIIEGEKTESILEKFDKTQAWRLPVVDKDKKYLGFISKSRILMAYRNELKEISLED